MHLQEYSSTSSSVVASLKDSRSEPWATSWGRPMASSTWLGSSEPEVQADRWTRKFPPVQHQQKALALDALKAEIDVAGQPPLRSAVEAAVGNGAKQPGDQLIPQGDDARRRSPPGGRRPASRAAAMPDDGGRFSVPARRPFSWAPPSMRGPTRSPLRTCNAPTPLGPWNLCAGKGENDRCASPLLHRICPTACTASVWNSTPLPAHAHQLGDGLDGADFIVGEHHRTPGRCPAAGPPAVPPAAQGRRSAPAAASPQSPRCAARPACAGWRGARRRC